MYVEIIDLVLEVSPPYYYIASLVVAKQIHHFHIVRTKTSLCQDVKGYIRCLLVCEATKIMWEMKVSELEFHLENLEIEKSRDFFPSRDVSRQEVNLEISRDKKNPFLIKVVGDFISFGASVHWACACYLVMYVTILRLAESIFSRLFPSEVNSNEVSRPHSSLGEFLKHKRQKLADIPLENQTSFLQEFNFYEKSNTRSERLELLYNALCSIKATSV